MTSSVCGVRVVWIYSFFVFFFFNDTATTEIYTLSLHDALPISLNADPQTGYDVFCKVGGCANKGWMIFGGTSAAAPAWAADRKSTRLNSSHGYISYAVFCLKKKKSPRNVCGIMTASSPMSRSIT